MDTLQDRHGIIASVLHIAMIDKIPILKSAAERQDLEDKCKGRCNILFLFLKELGSYEHRVFMETAMRISDKYLCALTTDHDSTVGLSEPDLQNDGENHGKTEKEPRLWALQCSNVEPQSGHSCLQAVHWMRIDLTSVNVFLQAVDMEPWVEVKPSSDRICTEYDNLELPKVFLTYDKNAKEQVINIANQLNTFYRGALGICIIDRTLINKHHLKSLGLNEVIYPPDVMFLQPDDTRVAVFSGFQDSFNFIREQLQQYYTVVLNKMSSMMYDEESLDEECYLLSQDDPVAVALRRIGGPNVTSIRALTDKTMPKLLEDIPVAMVIFYVDWDPESLIVLHMFTRLAVRFEGEPNLLARVNCFDWTDICQHHNVTQYPTIRLYERGEQPITYKGMFDESMLWNTLLIFKEGSSVKLETPKEVEAFMEGEESFQFTRNLTVIILGGFLKYSHEALRIYRQVGEELRSQFPFASVVGDVAEDVGRKYNVRAPFIMVTRRNDRHKNVTVVSWNFSDCSSLAKFIEEESLPIFPEVNDLTYVSLRQQNRPLAILVGSTSQISQEEHIFSKLAFQQRQLKQISLSWLDG
ncbi:thioredoxin domain-containing protein 16-like [Limulus polyphemus]|uniref:Thioredoxin domain-containing protein 16-like n=1 Tax=Limulus polyphemus TaxID=6850 RepID=A0ABM1TPI9_LIMPO|nr:thioredoxin domain-containing protein 16-like [Limulus polyphemus]